uniref:GH16 domain-containing protein n=1 Tax=Acrobeloides nanus TaxID=290746 RepID=A0A914DZ49_9BILA
MKSLLIALFFLNGALAQQCSYYPDSDISISPINYEPGGMDDCCKICEYTPGCGAFTWSGYNGGTCWLKNITGPLIYAPKNIVGILNKNVIPSPLPSINKCTMQSNTDIPGNDMINIPNSQASDCCNLCYLTQGCKAYTWSSVNNGTCWLKSGTTTSNNNGIIAGILTPATISWTLRETYDSTNFYSKFDFYTDGDPTHGYVDFVNQSVAQQKGLIAVNSNGTIYMGADHTNKATGRGRKSVRLSSKAAYNGGLFIHDLVHMPVGPGTWPAYWFIGPDWPNNGEADIIEGIGGNTKNAVTLHTADGCTMRKEYQQLFTGTFADGKNPGVPSTDCFIQDW